MKQVSADRYGPIYDAQRKLLSQIVERAEMAAIERSYVSGQKSIVYDLFVAYLSVKDQFGSLAQRGIVVLLRHRETEEARAMLEEIVKHAESATNSALDSFVESLHELDTAAEHSHHVPKEQIDEVKKRAKGRLAAVRSNLTGDLAKAYAGLISLMVNKLSFSLLEQRPMGDEIRRLESLALREWYLIERIARTQVAWAFNATRADAIEVIGRADDPEHSIFQRWTERIDDDTGRPKDDKVAFDSMALHGQVTPPGGMFTMPPDPRVDHQMWGKSWAHPPNRPNDRCVLTPWRKGWGVPAWIWVNGEKHWLNRL